MPFRGIASRYLIGRKESKRQSQFAFAEWFAKRKRPAKLQPPQMRYWSDKRDPAELVAVFMQAFDGAGYLLHLVWNDEIHPNPNWDAEYRKLRKQKYHRQTDIETIAIDGDFIYFPRDWAGPQSYGMHFHLPGIRRNTGNLYATTWNHMLNTRPGLFAKYDEDEPRFFDGTRKDAEQFAPKPPF